MDIAIVTGAETPLGLSLIQRLIRQGYRVHGVGSNFSKVTFADPHFSAHPVDLCDLGSVTRVLEGILEKENSLDLLIHALDVTPGAAFEKLPLGNLEAVLKIGLMGPVLLTRLALPNLIRFRGQLINVIPANKSGHPASAVNALIEGGLREMNRALFDRARDAGLRVTNLILRQNPEPDGLQVQSSAQTHIDLEDVARVVELLLDPNYANVPAELTLFPQASARADQRLPEMPLPLDPYSEVVLPPKAYCPPEQPKIPTQERQKVERTIPYTDDEMEDKIAAAIEDFEAHPERYEQSEPKSPAKPPAHKPESSQPRGDSGEGGGGKRRRGRRRGGRNRNRDREQTPGADARENQSERTPPEKPQPNEARGNQTNREERPREKRPHREKRPETDQKAKSLSDGRVIAAKPPRQEAAPPSSPTPSAKKATKTAAKKAAKKTAAKKAAKKTATKKKVATKKAAVKKTAKRPTEAVPAVST